MSQPVSRLLCLLDASSPPADAAVSFYGNAGAHSQSKDFVSDVEVRRNAFEAVCAIAANPANRLVGQR